MLRERYLGLDAVRGVAAIAVLVLHYGVNLWSFRGYLAVDIFFVLSGFVIAHAYESKLLTGLTFKRFALLRIIRLYPLVLAAVVGSVLIAALLFLMGRGDLTYSPSEVIFALLLLPYISANIDMFPVVSPTWSLFNELAVNFGYALLATRLSNRWLVRILVVAGITLIPAIIIHGSVQFGPFRGTLLLGLVRTIFSFTAGVLIYRFRSHQRLSGVFPLCGAVFATGAIVAVTQGGAYGGVYDAFAVAFGIPAIIAFAAHIEMKGLSAAVSSLLGDLSYPIYLVHWPLRTLVFTSGLQSRVPAFAFLTISAVFVALVSFVALKIYDEPLRRLLVSKIIGRDLPRSHPATAP